MHIWTWRSWTIKFWASVWTSFVLSGMVPPLTTILRVGAPGTDSTCHDEVICAPFPLPSSPHHKSTRNDSICGEFSIESVRGNRDRAASSSWAKDVTGGDEDIKGNGGPICGKKTPAAPDASGSGVWVTDIEEVKRRFRLTATTHATATASTLSGDRPTYPRFPQIANHSRLYQKDETRNQRRGRKGNADAQSRHD